MARGGELDPLPLFIRIVNSDLTGICDIGVRGSANGMSFVWMLAFDRV